MPLHCTLIVYMSIHHNTCRCTGRYVISKLQGLKKREDDECEIEENVAYATAHGDRLWSQNFFLHKEEAGGEEDCVRYEGEREEIPEVDYAPDIPSREYLKEKEVICFVYACMTYMDMIN